MPARGEVGDSLAQIARCISLVPRSFFSVNHNTFNPKHKQQFPEKGQSSRVPTQTFSHRSSPGRPAIRTQEPRMLPGPNPPALSSNPRAFAGPISQASSLARPPAQCASADNLVRSQARGQGIDAEMFSFNSRVFSPGAK